MPVTDSAWVADRWRSFDSLYSSTYKKITETVAPSKPLMIRTAAKINNTQVGGVRRKRTGLRKTRIVGIRLHRVDATQRERRRGWP